MTSSYAVPLITLLVEDDPADAELIALRLDSASRAGGDRVVQLIRSETVAAACRVLRHARVDAIILDLSLPDARGLEALHQVREAAAGTPVIVLTGASDQSMAVDALRAGAQDYVLKPPPDGASLARIIRYACERQRLLLALDASLHASATAEQQWRVLAEIGEVLAPVHDVSSALGRVARRIVPEMADCFVVFLAGPRKKHGADERWHLHGEGAHALRDALRVLLRRHGPAALEGSVAWREAMQGVFASLRLRSGSAVPLHVNGRVRGLLVLASTSAGGDGLTGEAFARAVADRIDVALAQARQLRRTERAVSARDRAVSIVSHDLRSPLSTIQICAKALLDPEPAPASGVRQMGELIQRSAEWMQQIVNELLDRAALDSGGLPLNRKPTEVTEIITAARAMFSTLAASREIDFVLHSATHLPMMDADPHRLLQALSNLIGNAMKFTPAGGRVELLAQDSRADQAGRIPGATTNPGVRFSVRDTGHGIATEDLEHVFDWFWHSPREDRGGIGLGLAIAKGIVEAHRGRLHVESAIGLGSTFWFNVPAVGSAPGGRHNGGMVS
jgi:signal transduction histidine kinase/DNA-binding NarL/FixJ family response regulator